MLTGAKSRCVCIFYFLSYGHLWGGLICYSVLPWSSSDLIGKNRGHAGGKPESHLYSWWELSCSTCVAYICWQMSLLILSAGVKRFTGPSNLTTLAHEHWTRADYCLAGQSLLPEGSKVETICPVGQLNGVTTSSFQIDQLGDSVERGRHISLGIPSRYQEWEKPSHLPHILSTWEMTLSRCFEGSKSNGWNIL